MEYRISLEKRATVEARARVVSKPHSTVSRPRLAVICDMKEENWPSMDLVVEMLFAHLEQDHSDAVAATLLRPPMRRRFTRVWSSAHYCFNADRFVNRFWDYRRLVQKKRGSFDLFHVVDHSYGQLVHHLPPERTIVTCHDLDAFRCLLKPEVERRSKPFKVMAKRVLEGVQKAARVTCDSAATRDELLSYQLLPPERVVVVHNGVSSIHSTEPDRVADAEAARLLGSSPNGTVDILHVGSTIRRKRIDVLLQVFAEVRKEFPAARLVRVGGAFTEAQLRLIERLKISSAIVVLPFLEERVLAAIYRRAALLLQTSEGEGFGLPVVEALACGTHVVASDLPVLREVGGEAASYCAVADVPAWTETVVGLLAERGADSARRSARRKAGNLHAAKFSWSEYARKMVALYRELLQWRR